MPKLTQSEIARLRQPPQKKCKIGSPVLANTLFPKVK